jgi:hypothetical protein
MFYILRFSPVNYLWNMETLELFHDCVTFFFFILTVQNIGSSTSENPMDSEIALHFTVFFRPKRVEVSGKCRKLNNEKLMMYNLLQV